MGNTALVHRVNNHQGCNVLYSIIVGAILMTKLLKGLRLDPDFGICNYFLGTDRFLLLNAWINSSLLMLGMESIVTCTWVGVSLSYTTLTIWSSGWRSICCSCRFSDVSPRVLNITQHAWFGSGARFLDMTFFKLFIAGSISLRDSEPAIENLRKFRPGLVVYLFVVILSLLGICK